MDRQVLTKTLKKKMSQVYSDCNEKYCNTNGVLSAKYYYWISTQKCKIFCFIDQNLVELCEKIDVSGKVGKDPWLIATRIYLWLMLINQVPKYHNLFATEFQSCISACKKHSVVGKLRIHIWRVAALTSAGLEKNSATLPCSQREKEHPAGAPVWKGTRNDVLSTRRTLVGVWH